MIKGVQTWDRQTQHLSIPTQYSHPPPIAIAIVQKLGSGVCLPILPKQEPGAHTPKASIQSKQLRAISGKPRGSNASRKQMQRLARNLRRPI